MTTQISGTTGVSQVQDGVVTQADLAANVVGNGPAFSAYRSAVQSIDNTNTTVLVCDIELFDTNNAYNSSTGVFTAPVSGRYLFEASVHFATATSNVAMFLKKNGVTVSYLDNSSVIRGACNGCRGISLAVNDTVSIGLYSATTQNIIAGELYSRLSGFLVRTA